MILLVCMCDLQLMAETKQLTGHEVRREISMYFTEDRVAKMLTVFSAQVSGQMKHLLNSIGYLSNLDEQSKYFLIGVSIVIIHCLWQGQWRVECWSHCEQRKKKSWLYHKMSLTTFWMTLTTLMKRRRRWRLYFAKLHIQHSGLWRFWWGLKAEEEHKNTFS